MNLSPLPQTTFIGLGHRARQGKDFVARAIHNYAPATTWIYRLADPVKSICRVDYGMTVKDSPLLQRVGTEIYRAKDPGVWLRALYWAVAEERPRFALVPDVRFVNEVEFIRSLGGYSVKVMRFNEDGTPFVASDRDPNHPSECELEDYQGWDYIIRATSGDMASLEKQAIEVFQEIDERDGNQEVARCA
jgi:hypothetical protein